MAIFKYIHTQAHYIHMYKVLLKVTFVILAMCVFIQIKYANTYISVSFKKVCYFLSLKQIAGS